MNFVEKLFQGISEGFSRIIDGFQYLFELFAKPLSYILTFLEGVFYFITKFFQVVIEVVMIFTALFQFLFAVIAGVFRTIANWVGFTPSTSFNFPSTSEQGFNVFIDQIDPIGLFDVVPYLLIAFIWFMFAVKVIGLIGNRRETA